MAPILEAHFRRIRPNRVLDIGIGYGFWGALIRNYFGADQGGQLGHMLDRETWVPNPALTISGIEPFANYCNPMWDFYDGGVVRRNVEDIIDSVVRLAADEFVVCIDVMEHLKRAVAMDIFRATRKGVFGICTQMYDTPQAPYGNPLEDHITKFSPQEFVAAGCTVIDLNPLYFAVTVDR